VYAIIFKCTILPFLLLRSWVLIMQVCRLRADGGEWSNTEFGPEQNPMLIEWRSAMCSVIQSDLYFLTVCIYTRHTGMASVYERVCDWWTSETNRPHMDISFSPCPELRSIMGKTKCKHTSWVLNEKPGCIYLPSLSAVLNSGTIFLIGWPCHPPFTPARTTQCFHLAHSYSQGVRIKEGGNDSFPFPLSDGNKWAYQSNLRRIASGGLKTRPVLCQQSTYVVAAIGIWKVCCYSFSQYNRLGLKPNLASNNFYIYHQMYGTWKHVQSTLAN
jgi:hypothetical protein